ncbi:hypothetical protein GCM10023063_38890 [Arthrobacter methylotrophus]|uniref:Uncharacterized protein n=1 Tax=Arthrobacter methylotrophus TaxID=121291 RepID=A0ABV5UTP6_9MICC
MISVKPIRVAYNGKLDDLLIEIEDNKYPTNPTAPSEGFGSLQDEMAVVNSSTEMVFRPGTARIEDPGNGAPRRLRVRYYYDVLNKTLLRLLGQHSDWKATYVRKAFDITVYENTGEDGTSVLVSARDAPTVKNPVTNAVKAMFPSFGPGGVSMEMDTIPESVISDFFLWILYRFQMTQQLAPDVSISWVEEMASKDGMRRGARFTDDAAFGRVDLSSLIAGGNAHFGPAKIEIRDASLDANFSLEIHFDGGFVVYRSSHYAGIHHSSEYLGLALSDDLWITVLPKIRDEYNKDTEWTSVGRDKLTELARETIRASLNF